MALELLALAFWIPIGVLGLWLLATGRRTFFGLPKWPKEGWLLRVFGLVYVLLPGYFIYRAIHDASFAPDGVVAGYAVLIGVALVALYRRQMARRAQAADRV
jgi:hypothetical protein